MRLSEAAEKLKRQAAVSVISGKENDARELLFQKKKVMHAIGRSKNRIELLDQLSSKRTNLLFF
jgi:phage shock protein A